jgi:hypothetical protein
MSVIELVAFKLNLTLSMLVAEQMSRLSELPVYRTQGRALTYRARWRNDLVRRLSVAMRKSPRVARCRSSLVAS